MTVTQIAGGGVCMLAGATGLLIVRPLTQAVGLYRLRARLPEIREAMVASVYAAIAEETA